MLRQPTGCVDEPLEVVKLHRRRPSAEHFPNHFSNLAESIHEFGSTIFNGKVCGSPRPAAADARDAVF
jgi:hypothetical protein